MTIDEFAEANRMKVTRDECNDKAIIGKSGSIHQDGKSLSIYVIANGSYGIRIANERFSEFGKRTQNGDSEAVFKCDPKRITKKHAAMIVKTCRIRLKNNLSADAVEKLRERGRLLSQNLIKKV